MIGNSLVYGRMDRPTDILTDNGNISKTICPLFFEVGHNKQFRCFTLNIVALCLFASQNIKDYV